MILKKYNESHKKILLVFGTRPEAIKMAPLVKAFANYPDNFMTKVCVTGQHKEMLQQVLDFFEIVPDYCLNVMRPNQSLHNLIESFPQLVAFKTKDFHSLLQSCWNVGNSFPSFPYFNRKVAGV